MSAHFTSNYISSELIYTVFCKLCSWEMKKRLEIFPESFDGCQNGYMFCLSDLFGEATDEQAKQNFAQNQSWIHVLDNIISETDLHKYIDDKYKKCSDINLISYIDAQTKEYVKEYLQKNMDLARIALQYL